MMQLLPVYCPRCGAGHPENPGSPSPVRYGKKKGRQQYKCKVCKFQFIPGSKHRISATGFDLYRRIAKFEREITEKTWKKFAPRIAEIVNAARRFCPRCLRNGVWSRTVKDGRDARGRQRLRCKTCGYRFVSGAKFYRI